MTVIYLINYIISFTSYQNLWNRPRTENSDSEVAEAPEAGRPEHVEIPLSWVVVSDDDDENVSQPAHPNDGENMDQQADSAQDTVPGDPPAEAPVDDLPAPQPAARVEPPTFTPHVDAEGHRSICSILLPVLFDVLQDPACDRLTPRDQVRRACLSYMASAYSFF